MTKERVLAGYQIGFHAIGDKGGQMALDAFEQAEKAAKENKVKGFDGGTDYRLRIEHAQVTTPAQILKFKELKVIASMQPSHLLTDMNWAESRLGPKRASHSYAWAEFLKLGVVLAFGTDYPVEPVTPFRGLYAAVTRQNEKGKKTYYPEQKISIEQAITAYTAGSAFAEFGEPGHHVGPTGKASRSASSPDRSRRQDGIRSEPEVEESIVETRRAASPSARIAPLLKRDPKPQVFTEGAPRPEN